MSEQEKNKRREAVLFSDCINATEGVTPSPLAVKLSQTWADGEIEWQDMVRTLVEQHTVPKQHEVPHER